MNKTNLLKKVNALAEGGVGGEKENAKKLAKKIKQKYNLTDETEPKKEEPKTTIPKEYFFNLTKELAKNFKIN